MNRHEQQPRKVDLRVEQEIRTEEVRRREKDLLTHGFSQAWIAKVAKDRPTLFSIATVTNHIDGLSQRGFTNPQKMIQTFPSLLRYSFDYVDNKIGGLQERGFDNPQKMIQRQPTILGYTLENIDNKIGGLQERGFDNPQKMVQTLPEILTINLENIDNKLKGLQKRGFSNPQNIIQNFPAILTLSFKNIDKRLNILGNLQTMYNLPFSPIEAMEKVPKLWSSKKDKLFITARLLRDAKIDPQKTTPQFLKEVLMQNLEDTLVASSIRKEDEPAERIVFLAKQVKKQGLSTGAKRQIIKDSPNLSDKLKRSYFRGYPEK